MGWLFSRRIGRDGLCLIFHHHKSGERDHTIGHNRSRNILSRGCFDCPFSAVGGFKLGGGEHRAAVAVPGDILDRNRVLPFYVRREENDLVVCRYAVVGRTADGLASRYLCSSRGTVRPQNSGGSRFVDWPVDCGQVFASARLSTQIGVAGTGAVAGSIASW